MPLANIISKKNSLVKHANQHTTRMLICIVATTIEIMTTIEIIISIVVENEFQT